MDTKIRKSKETGFLELMNCELTKIPDTVYNFETITFEG